MAFRPSHWVARRTVSSALLAAMVLAPSLAWSSAEEEHASSAATVIDGEANEVGAEGAEDSPEPYRSSPALVPGEQDSSNRTGEEDPTERSLTLEEVLSLAQALLVQGQLDDAEKIYRSLLQSSANESIRIEAAFQIGQILVYRGRYREAALYFIDILNHKPDLPRVRLELARAYFLDKNYPDATFQFELVKGGNLPPEVIVNVDTFLDSIRRQKNWSLDFSMNPAVDSNISQTSGDKEECVDIWGMLLCRPLDKKTSGIGLNVDANLDYFKRFSQDWGLRASAGINALEYSGSDFDDYSLYAALGPRYLWTNGEASLQPTFRKRWYAKKQYREEYGLRVDGRQVLGRFILDSTASYTANNYDNTYLHNILNGYAWRGRLQPRYILNDRTFVQIGLDFLHEKTNETAYSNDNWTYSLGAYRILPYGFSLFLQGSLTESKYKAPQWYVTKDNRIDEAVRRDKTWGLTVMLSSNRFEKYNLTPIVRYSYTKRNSNIWSREYERNRLDLLMNLRI